MQKRYKEDAEFRVAFRTWVSRRKARRKHWLNHYKKHKGCEVCGYNEYAVALDFHHRDRSTKEIDISDNMGRKLKTLVSEIRKCMVVCSNCHRVLHMKEKERGL